MQKTAIPLPTDDIRQYCQSLPIARLALFGSILSDNFTATSDVDMLIEFMHGARVTYLDLVEIQLTLESLIGRSVDLVTPGALSPYFQADVIDHAEVLYEAG
jgi:predicted nucleotidyltransferase